MIKTIISTLILATVSLTASAEYTIKMPLMVSQGGTLPDNSISFSGSSQPTIEDQFLIDCPITSEDITSHGAALLDKWAEPENGFKCVVSIAVEKNLYDGACNPNYQIQSDSLFNLMRSRGMDGLSSIRYDGECSGNEPDAPASYEVSMSIYIQNSGDNILFNGVSQSGYSNAESSYFDSSTNQFFLSNTYEGYFWHGVPEYEQYAPNVGGLIQFDGKGVDCLISQISTSGSGSLYTCSNDVSFSSGAELINVVFYKRTN